MKSHKALVAIMAAVIIGAVVAVVVLIVVIRGNLSDKSRRGAGVLEFRIAPTLPLPGAADEKMLSLTKQQYETYLNRLAEQAPTTMPSQDEKYLWFPLHGKGEMLSTNLVIGERGDKKYILLYNQPGYTMLNDPRSPSWSVSSAYPTRDVFGKPAVGIELDKRGAKLMASLTGAHKDHSIAILLNNEVYSAPVIRDTVHDRAVITGNFTVQEVGKLVRILEAGSRPSSNRAEPRKIPTSSPAQTN